MFNCKDFFLRDTPVNRDQMHLTIINRFFEPLFYSILLAVEACFLLEAEEKTTFTVNCSLLVILSWLLNFFGLIWIANYRLAKDSATVQETAKELEEW